MFVCYNYADKFLHFYIETHVCQTFVNSSKTLFYYGGTFNPIQTGLFWSICDWGGGGGLLGPPLCISGTNNARVMKFTHNDHLRTKKPHTQS